MNKMAEEKTCWEISDENLTVTFSKETNEIMVTDRRIFKVWRQMPFGGGFHVENVEQMEKRMVLGISGPLDIWITIELIPGAELLFTVSADFHGECDRVPLPMAFVTPDKNHYLVETDSEGFLLPVEDTQYPLEEQPMYFCGGGQAMSWIGMVDTALQSGYMAIFETPYDVSVQLLREDGRITFAPVWRSSMGTFSYERRIRYVFFDRGGYVAQCKRYRSYIWPKNHVTTLREKQKMFPAIEKILGAVHVYLWDKARETEFVEKMKKAGIKKAFLLWNPNHKPYPEKGYDQKVIEQGYCSGCYELFTDIHPDQPGHETILKEIPLKRNLYPGKFESITSRKKDGSTYVNQYGTFVCPRAVRTEMRKRIEQELEIYPHESYFLDVWQANGLYECYQPHHKLTRQQYAQTILENYKMLEEDYQVFLGGEFGVDFANSDCVYAHGMMTLQRMWWYQPDAGEKGTIYYMGDWKNPSRPTIMLGARTATKGYMEYGINEALRVPLYELVYHDAVVTSWRWEDCNHHNPEIWWKKDLFNILYGSAPLWSIDQERWEVFQDTFIESYKSICPWLQEICYDEMISHSFLSEDRKVQRSCFSSGKHVVVNFGDSPYWHDGKKVDGRGYLIESEEENNKRR